MKKIIDTLVFSTLIFSFFGLVEGCSKSSSVSACISGVPPTASVGAPVTFISCTQGANSYSWNFGDNNTGSGDTTTHTYSAAGTYNGSLTVNSGGSSNTKNFTITVVANNWSFKGSTFVADSVVKSGGITLSAGGISGGNEAVLNFVFQSLPTSSGNYTVVNAYNNNVATGQVYVNLYSFTGSTQTAIYGSTGSGSVSAAVTVTNGNISISLPTIEVVKQVPNSSDSTSLSASVTETK